MPSRSVVTYEVVQHDGGWAYRLGDTFSESFGTAELATAGARRAAREQRLEGSTELIEYQDEEGRWHLELATGDDRPLAVVEPPLRINGDRQPGPSGRLAGSPAEKQGFDEAFLAEEPAFEPLPAPEVVATFRSLVIRRPLPCALAALAAGYFLGRRF
jgi:hypothetical protein